MKNFFFILIAALTVSCKPDLSADRLPGSIVNNPAAEGNKPPEGNYAVISFDSTLHIFGSLKEGEVVEHSFRFRNTGTSNLIITDVRASCGCTSPSWPKEIIKPGESENIVVSYNSKGREGNFSKSVTVYTNAYPGTVTLGIQGVVYPK